LHFVGTDGTLIESKVVTGALEINGPAAVGSSAIWVGGESGSLYPVGFDRELGAACDAGEAISGAPAIVGNRVVASTNASYVVVADTISTCNIADVAATAPPVIALERVLVPVGGKLRNFSIRTNGVLRDEWTGAPPSPDVGDVQALLAVDAQDAVWSVSTAGPVVRTTASATAAPLTLDPVPSTNSTGPIILSDGTAVIGDRVPAQVRRVSAGTGATWTSAALTGSPAIPLALGGATPALLVPTSRGYLYLLRQSNGEVLWSKRITPSNQGLEPPNIWTEAGATTSTAYLSGADGVLYAVIVDGALDTSAPWPKAYHDPQNTSNAGSPP
jgi:outer membrane protein assembly factor BamB